MRRLVGLVLCLALAGCQLTAPFRGEGAPQAAPAAGVTAAPGAIAGAPVTATAIAAPGTAKPATPGATAKPAPAAAPVAPPAASPAQGAPIPPGTIKARGTPPAPPAAAAPEPAKPADPSAGPPADPPAPEAPKSAAQLACEGDRGQWLDASGKGVKACVFRTRDGGKACKREGDCDGVCLARSMTCSPYKPLFGCNDILQADGRQVTLCLD